MLYDPKDYLVVRDLCGTQKNISLPHTASFWSSSGWGCTKTQEKYSRCSETSETILPVTQRLHSGPNVRSTGVTLTTIFGPSSGWRKQSSAFGWLDN